MSDETEQQTDETTAAQHIAYPLHWRENAPRFASKAERDAYYAEENRKLNEHFKQQHERRIAQYRFSDTLRGVQGGRYRAYLYICAGCDISEVAFYPARTATTGKDADDALVSHKHWRNIGGDGTQQLWICASCVARVERAARDKREQSQPTE